jgi:hypothetical protein
VFKQLFPPIDESVLLYDKSVKVANSFDPEDRKI